MKVLEQLTDLENETNYVLYFTASWCGDCRYIEPYMAEIEAQFPQYNFIKVDRDEWIDFCMELGIMGIPSFVVVKNNKEVDRFVGRQRKTKQEVIDFLTQCEEK